MAWEEVLTLPTYWAGPPDPNPPFHRSGYWGIYPYSMLDDLGVERGTRDYRAVILENEYLRVTVLPELGGHLFSAFNKASGAEIFYRNNVVKPGLVALRGAWISGGIEFNFPVGHSTTTVSPVDYRLVEHADGSATCWVGNLEAVARMKWLVGLRLAPGRAWLETEIRLFNRTCDRERFYFWANSAVPATEDLHLVYPAKKALTGGGVVDYPILPDGRDISWYRNHEHADDIFTLGVKEDFFGCYYPERDVGLVHWGRFRDAVGKKFFTWGTAESGLIWATLLSDTDGPYCEIQSGRFVDQGTWEFLEPHAAEWWKEYWWGLHGMGHFVWANRDVAVNLEVQGETVQVAVGASQAWPGATIQVIRTGPGLETPQTILEQKADLAPDRPFRTQIKLEGRGEKGKEEEGKELLALPQASLQLRVYDAHGVELIRYTAGQEPRFDPSVAEAKQRRQPPEAEMTPGQLCAAAVNQEKGRAFEEARRLYERALKLDPHGAEALCGLGALDYRAGLYESAAERLQQALKVDPDAWRAHYLLGLTFRALGQEVAAEDALWRVVRRREFEPAACYALAELALQRQDWPEAEMLLRRALTVQPCDGRACGLLAATLRHAGRPAEARTAIAAALEIDPLDALAYAEQWFLETPGLPPSPNSASGKALRQRLKGAPQPTLELATDYGNAGLLEEALTVLELGLLDAPGPGETVCRETPLPNPHPLLLYFRGFYLEQLGQEEAAREAFAAGKSCSPAYVFPYSLEALPVLRRVLEVQPDDARAHLYLGNLLYARGRTAEALPEWAEAVRLEPGLAIAHRNLGWHAWQVEQDLDRAAACYDQAIAANPLDYRYFRDRDDIGRQRGEDFAARLARLESAPADVRRRQDLVSREATLNNLLGRFDAAYELLMKTTFLPWEGAVAMRQVYLDAVLGQGRQALARGDYEAARVAFSRGLEYPCNIGVGRPKNTQDAQSYVLLAEALKGLGHDAEAAAALQQAVAERPSTTSPGRYWQLRALQALGRGEEATAGAQEMLEAARRRAERHPHEANAQLTWGLAALLNGHRDTAREAFDRAIALDPQCVEARWQRQNLD